MKDEGTDTRKCIQTLSLTRLRLSFCGFVPKLIKMNELRLVSKGTYYLTCIYVSQKLNLRSTRVITQTAKASYACSVASYARIIRRAKHATRLREYCRSNQARIMTKCYRRYSVKIIH